VDSNFLGSWVADGDGHASALILAMGSTPDHRPSIKRLAMSHHNTKRMEALFLGENDEAIGIAHDATIFK
jgi:hypothetical protein